MQELIGQALDQYTLVRLIGEGRLGSVYTAHEQQAEDEVAVKVLHTHLARRSDFVERFLTGMSQAPRWQHPGLVKVRSAGRSADQLYVAMELLPGPPLRQRLDQLQANGQWLILSEAVMIVQQIALVCEYLQRLDAPARDVRPQKIKLTAPLRGNLTYQPVLADLGLIQLLGIDWQAQAAEVFELYCYAAPETLSQNTLALCSTVYSLGVLLYELTTGPLPFAAGEQKAIREQPDRSDLPNPRQRFAALPADLEAILLKALAAQPAERFATPGELASALAAIKPATLAIATGPANLTPVSLDMRQDPPAAPRQKAEPAPSTPIPARQAKPNIDHLLVEDEAGQAQQVALKQPVMIIGRTPENDLVLENSKISKRHAQIEIDSAGYYIQDLGSRNGSFLNGQPLAANQKYPWLPGQVLTLGPYRLQLADGRQLATASARLTLDAGRFSVDPGGSVTLALTVRNEGSIVDQFLVALEGIPASWLSSQLPTVELLPDTQKTLLLSIQPPRVPQSRAREYHLTLRATIQKTDVEAGRTTATLMVQPFYSFTAELLPPEVRAGRQSKLVITNQGNTPQTYQMLWQDRKQNLQFEAPETVVIDPGETDEVAWRAAQRQRAWFGNETSEAFTVAIIPTNRQSEKQEKSGQITSTARLPRWTTAAPIALLALLMGVRTFWAPTFKVTEVIPNPPVAQTPFAVAWEALNARQVDIFSGIVPIATGLAPKATYVFASGLPASAALHLEAQGWLFNAATREIVVTVMPPTATPVPPTATPPAPSIQAFSVKPSTFTKGTIDEVCFSYQLDGAASASIEPKPGALKEMKQGEICAEAPQKSTVYTLVAQNALELAVKSAITVTVVEAQLKISAPVANLRTGPGIVYDIVRELTQGMTLIALSKPVNPTGNPDDGQWAQVQVQETGQVGWVEVSRVEAQNGVELTALPPPAGGSIGPTPTPPPTATTVPTATPLPTNTATPEPKPIFFAKALLQRCIGQNRGTMVEGTTYVNHQQADGYKVVYSNQPFGTILGDATSRTTKDGKVGFYQLTIQKERSVAGMWYVWVVDANGRPASNPASWTSSGTPATCNKAIIDFDTQ